MKSCFLFIGIIALAPSFAQKGYWQQYADYRIDVDVDVQANTLAGRLKLIYQNNSPDTLTKLFFHLYWNAFQPESEMAEAGKKQWHSKNKWISDFSSNEVGYQKVKSIKVGGKPQELKQHDTILEVVLSQPISPHSVTNLDMVFVAQIPKIIRRAGRDNSTGVRYSIAQWYPKICEYDINGWHTDPYVGDGQFYGVWGNYDVTIRIDSNYVLGATGFLLNSNEIGYGYEKAGSEVKRGNRKKLSWHFNASKVHDFVWGADPDYKHIVRKIPTGPTIHVLYNQDSTRYPIYSKQFDKIEQYWKRYDSLWNKAANAIVDVFPFIEKNFGKYPYKQFSIIEGGNGPMEYAMATLVTDTNLEFLFHELMHSWYQGVLANDEQEYSWMDEGFAQWAGEEVYYYYIKNILKQKLPEYSQIGTKDTFDRKQYPLLNIHHTRYSAYLQRAINAKSEPMSTWTDHYVQRDNNTDAYSKGLIFLEQLGYIAGNKVRDKILLEYYRQWRFKHPSPNDFIRVAEKVSDMQLGWYKMYWINTTQTIDYGIDSVWSDNKTTNIKLRKYESMPMPIDLNIKYKDGSKECLYIPLDLMFGQKPVEDKAIPRRTYKSWLFVQPVYTLILDRPLEDIEEIEIDPSYRMADVNRANNSWTGNKEKYGRHTGDNSGNGGDKNICK